MGVVLIGEPGDCSSFAVASECMPPIMYRKVALVKKKSLSLVQVERPLFRIIALHYVSNTKISILFLFLVLYVALQHVHDVTVTADDFR